VPFQPLALQLKARPAPFSLQASIKGVMKFAAASPLGRKCAALEEGGMSLFYQLTGEFLAKENKKAAVQALRLFMLTL
jgi:hypothetical protein